MFGIHIGRSDAVGRDCTIFGRQGQAGIFAVGNSDVRKAIFLRADGDISRFSNDGTIASNRGDTTTLQGKTSSGNDGARAGGRLARPQVKSVGRDISASLHCAPSGHNEGRIGGDVSTSSNKAFLASIDGIGFDLAAYSKGGMPCFNSGVGQRIIVDDIAEHRDSRFIFGGADDFKVGRRAILRIREIDGADALITFEVVIPQYQLTASQLQGS
ncbi:hypothetical protein, partial [Desulfovibrio sp.]|uniref:hypothetical protein n=1 Tax=Desulfovibrio sp. TaxID=885 RepID=UPI003AB27613